MVFTQLFSLQEYSTIFTGWSITHSPTPRCILRAWLRAWKFELNTQQIHSMHISVYVWAATQNPSKMWEPYHDCSKIQRLASHKTFDSDSNAQAPVHTGCRCNKHTSLWPHQSAYMGLFLTVLPPPYTSDLLHVVNAVIKLVTLLKPQLILFRTIATTINPLVILYHCQMQSRFISETVYLHAITAFKAVFNESLNAYIFIKS